jgi:catechol 2,3-dioxygenase-like lactoylglutathione lyase family enzyme
MTNSDKLEMKFELVPVPVGDIDRAKDFYVEKLGFDVDVDVEPGGDVRVVQLTPPGSACSIVLGAGLPQIAMDPGTIRGLHLVVRDIAEARETLMDKGIEIAEIDEQAQGVKYAGFSDPDGNTWTLQEMPWRSQDWS